ncbi:uncharacterized protein LOC131683537 [Topomyia yanbarensis]|uniref:uncharacterized protein LOC131683537 n=1 Tax=Topomyia yanbarensis TaxID=2498891 RepID=UPI00273B9BA3|nr:uncharacterized protein LOC131683537 [Topomyia yanbarensis]XP_058821574.1 uncharacterized protein LOC131683537 [Topomyia yanbarensis]
MATSVYATPPPDFSGEEATLSDTSNSSQTISSNNSATKASKRSLSSTFLDSPHAINTITQLSSDSLPDLSKKRRKQSMPSRISANGQEGGIPVDGADNENGKPETCAIETIASAFAEHQNNFQKIFLSNLSQLQKQHLLQQRLNDQPDDVAHEELILNGSDSIISLKNQESLLSLPSTLKGLEDRKEDSKNTSNSDEPEKLNGNEETSFDRNENEIIERRNDDKVDSFDNNVEARMELPNNGHLGDQSHRGFTFKREVLQNTEWDGEIRSSFISNESKSDDWLPIPGLPFPFSPEATAALSASGYLPQMPLLGMSSVSSFGTNDNANRTNVPPLRIFNPEAYCGLCNKEFCNKYFLKTHKANKHGIYEPQSGTNEALPNIGSFNPLHQFSQVFQLQQQQAALQEQQEQSSHQNPNQNADHIPQQLPQMHPMTTPKLPINPIQPTVFCDICFKKFSSLSAMRKHRSKAHDRSTNQQQQPSQLQHQPLQPISEHKTEPESPSNLGQMTPNGAPLRLPDGFREDYSIEQEDAPFTPQPRQLSPLSIQAAREANFSAEKLKLLGVMNPEAFCEICCKEYCNTYFLRTHKLKRHGIFPPSEEIKDEQRSPWNFIQTSPLNLIVGNTDVSGLPPPLRTLSENEENNLPKIDLLKDVDANKSADEEQNQADVSDVKQGDSNAEQEAEAISVDLQKLQSMIMQLNDLNNQRKMTCGVCGKEMENQYLLHAHMIQEHNNMNENNNGVKSSPELALMPTSPNEYEVCKQCDKEFSNAFMLKQHLIEVHGTANGSLKREGFITPDRPTTTPTLSMPPGPSYIDRKPTFSMTPTSSYCEICNKELCNKYFMKTHMQRMHGIEIENGAQIGGVVCNICNKELCSKYFLRVHKHNTHGIVEEGSPLPQTRSNGESAGVKSEGPFSPDSMLKPGEISDVSNRYYSHFTEVCPLCSRRFRSAKWLRAHLLSDHGTMGAEKLREIEHKLGSGNKPNSPSLKIPNGGLQINTAEQKFNPKASFGFQSPGAKFLMKNPFCGLFGVDPSNSNVGPKGYQCSYCPFATPLLPLLFIHERTHTSLDIVQQQLLQEEEKQQHQDSSPPSLVIKSESAVSLARDVSSYSIPTSIPSTVTPSLTPASTPVPSATQEPLNLQPSTAQQPFDRDSPPAPSQDSHKSPTPKSERNGLLSEMANLTQRPAVYALPQQSGPLLMQSFLLEESVAGHPKNPEEQPPANRFVPAVVFLPVKERILAPMTISFTLSPA